jgi:large subunit ribosomal protein L35
LKKYKIKSHSGAKRRFRITSTGKVLRREIGISHNRRKKSDEFLHGVSEMVLVKGRIARKIKHLLPYGVR